jgi:hypothetical protein
MTVVKVLKRRIITRPLIPKFPDVETVSAPQQSLLLSLQKRFSNDEEEFFFSNFQRSTAVQLAGFFHTHLWCELILQACETEPAILHAIIAMGALSFTQHKAYASFPRRERRQFAFDQYSKAISLHRQSAAMGRTDLRTNLIIFFVFINFEIMTGFMDSAFTLTYTGIYMLEDFFKAANPNHTTSISSLKPLQVENVLVQAFSRLELHALGYVDMRSPEEHRSHMAYGQESIDNMPNCFETLQEALVYLELVLRRSVHWAMLHKNTVNDCSVTFLEASSWMDQNAELAKKKEMLDKDFMRWEASFKYLWELANSSEGKHIRFAAMSVRLQYISGWLSKEVVRAEQESYYGRWDVMLEEIVNLSRDLIANSKDDGYVVWNVVALFPLVCVCLRYRTRRWRKEATELLLGSSRREGIWDSKVMGKAMKWFREVEEAGLDEQVEYVSEDRLLKNVSVVHNSEMRITCITCEQPLWPGSLEVVKRSLEVSWDEDGVWMG